MKPERPDPVAQLTGRLRPTPRPEAIHPGGDGGKFTPEGTVKPFPGNTVICHIDRTSEAFRKLAGLQDALKAGPHARHFTFLPAESLHMTVFPGVTEPGRGTARWPAGIPADAPMDAVTDELTKRMAKVHAPPRHSIRIDGLFAGYSVTVAGADAVQEASLRDLRDRLREATQIRDPDHDAYVFHISLAYQLNWVDEATAHEIVDLSARLGSELAAAVPVIDLGPPEVCTFETMYRFDPFARLGPDGLAPLAGDLSRRVG